MIQISRNLAVSDMSDKEIHILANKLVFIGFLEEQHNISKVQGEKAIAELCTEFVRKEGGE